jgi:hypothetical protein
MANSGDSLPSGERRSGKPSDPHQNAQRYEGFEGMNYEQIRQPYQPGHLRKAILKKGKDKETDGEEEA